MTNPTREWLQTLAAAFNNFPAQWLLDNGRDFGDWQPLPPSVRRGPIKACFWNSLELAARGRGRFVYCEGYAAGHIMPVEHAWCVDRETGLVVDTTWERGTAYVGVPIRAAYAKRCLNQERAVIMDWMGDYPVVRGKVPDKVWRAKL